MKKLISVLLALAMLFSLAACSSSASGKKSSEPSEGTEENSRTEESVEEASGSSSDESIAGGWSLPEDFQPVILPEDVQSAFDSATADDEDAALEPAALLAEQSVAGVNDAILCRADASCWKIAFIYRDPDGGAELLAVKNFPFSDYTHTDSEKDAEALQGGWSVVFSEGASVTDEAQKVFDQIPETDRDYHAVALLGTQVVAGTNYAVLAVSGEGSMDSPYQLTVLTVYQNLNGGIELVYACDLDVADFADFN